MEKSLDMNCSKACSSDPLLESHLMSRHFRPDCEAAVGKILEKTGGKCPLCPGKKDWSNKWNTLIHFSGVHKITQGLTYSDNKPNQDNINLILSHFV